MKEGCRLLIKDFYSRGRFQKCNFLIWLEERMGDTRFRWYCIFVFVGEMILRENTKCNVHFGIGFSMVMMIESWWKIYYGIIFVDERFLKIPKGDIIKWYPILRYGIIYSIVGFIPKV